MKRLIVLIMLLASVAFGDYLGQWEIDDYVMFTTTLHSVTTGGASAADAAPDIWIYEDDTAGQIVDETMAVFDSVTGLYYYKGQLTTAIGYDTGKHYTVLIQATVGSVSAITTHNFQVIAAPATAANQTSILDDTDDIGVAGAGLTAIDLPNQTMDITGDITGNLSGSVGSLTGHTVQTGDSYALVNSGTVGLAVIEGQTDDIGVAGAGLTAIPWNSAWDSEVQSEATDALVAANLDHLMLNAVDSNADMTTEVADGTVLSNLMSASSDTSTYVVADDSLQGISEGAAGGGATAQQVWEYTTRGLTILDEDSTTIDINGAVWDAANTGYADGTFGGDAVDEDDLATLSNGATTINTDASGNVSVYQLIASGLADLFNTDSGTVYGSAVSGSVVAEIADNAGGSSLTESGIAEAVWEDPNAGNLTQINGTSIAGTGTQVADAFEYWYNVATPAKTINDAGVAGSGLTAEEIWEDPNATTKAQQDLILADTAEIQGLIDANDNFPAQVEYVSAGSNAGTAADVTADLVADANWTSLVTDANTAAQAGGSTPAQFVAAWVADANWTDVATNIDDIETDTGTTLPNTLSTISGYIDTEVADINTSTDAILVDTGTTIPGTITTIDNEIATIDSEVGQVLADTGTDGVVIANDGITAAKIAVGAIEADALAANAIAAAAVATDVITEIWAAAMSDLASTPLITASVKDAINWIYILARNQTETTATEISIYKDNGSTKAAESDISDDGTTFTRGEYGTPD